MKMLKSENIVYADELQKLDLKEPKVKYSPGKTSLERLVKLLLDRNLYDNVKELH